MVVPWSDAFSISRVAAMLNRRRTIKLALALFAFAVVLPATSAPAATLYTNNYSDKQIAAFSVGGDGLLAPLGGSPFAVPDFLGGLAITPDGQRMIAPLYFNDQLGIYSLGADGVPSLVGSLVPADVTAAPAISPDGRFAYLGNGDTGGVRVYAIGEDGSLTQVGDGFGSNDGDGPALTPDGRFLLMPGYSDGSVERFAVQGDGSLVPLGTTPIAAENATVARVTPDGRFAIVVGNAIGGGSVESFAIGTDGSLAPVGAPLETVGTSSGRTPALSPNGRFFYIANRNEDSISTYSIGPDGALAEIGAAVLADVDAPDGIAMSPDGRFLFAVATFGDDVQSFAVAADGSLTKLGAPVPTGGESDGVGPVTRPAVPIARFAAVAAAPGSASSFDATASSDAGGTLTAYSWDFGDGATATSADPRPTHTYAKAGVYEVTLTVGDDAGCVGFVYTGQTAYCNAKGAQRTVRIDTPPAITSLKVIRKRFGKGRVGASARKGRRKPPKRIAFRSALSENARVVFTVYRERHLPPRGPGCSRKGGKGAVKRPCVRLRPIGSFGANGKAGVNVTRLPSRLTGRKPGAYQVIATATDTAGGKSAPRSVRFKLKPPPR
jgi:PKD domain/Lactonase, 7-bladed beta-propeller